MSALMQIVQLSKGVNRAIKMILNGISTVVSSDAKFTKMLMYEAIRYQHILVSCFAGFGMAKKLAYRLEEPSN